MTALEVTVLPADGSIRYTVDLSEFAAGGSAATVKKTTAWGGDYSGRPEFAQEFAQMLLVKRPSESRCDHIRAAMRTLFRYFDWKERQAASGNNRIITSADVTDAMGIEFRRWLEPRFSSYRQVKSALNEIRAIIGVRALFWPNRAADSRQFREPPSPEAMKRLYKALKQEGRDIKSMLAEGEALASAGYDPRWMDGGWQRRENHLFLMKHFLKSGVPDRKTLNRNGARRLLRRCGPDYLPPNTSSQKCTGAVGAIRWLVPGRAETAVFLWLFLLGTGWNLSTATGIDVLDPDGWSQNHPQSDKFSVIHAWKKRSDRHQFSISMTRPEWHPYRILDYIIEKTAPLRKQILAQLAEARRRAATRPGAVIEREIDILQRLSRTPWLFANFRKLGEVSGFIGQKETSLLSVVRSVVSRAGLGEAHTQLGLVVIKDARLAWIGHAYVNSGYQQLLAKLAGNHASLRTTRHYIRSMRYRVYSEDQVRKLQNAVFEEIDGGRVVDPTRLRLLVERGKITSEQERRLNDYRQRTKLGMDVLNRVRLHERWILITPTANFVGYSAAPDARMGLFFRPACLPSPVAKLNCFTSGARCQWQPGRARRLLTSLSPSLRPCRTSMQPWFRQRSMPGHSNWTPGRSSSMARIRVTRAATSPAPPSYEDWRDGRLTIVQNYGDLSKVPWERLRAVEIFPGSRLDAETFVIPEAYVCKFRGMSPPDSEMMPPPRSEN